MQNFLNPILLQSLGFGKLCAPMIILLYHLLVFSLNFGNQCLIGLRGFLKFALPLVADPFLLRKHLVMVEVTSTLLLTTPLICILLLKLQMLHFCCELLHLLPQACIFLLETPLHIVLQRFGLPLSLIGIFCFFFGALDLLAVLGVAILKILRTCTTGLEGEFHVTDLLG